MGGCRKKINITQGAGEVKEMKVFESFSPQRQNWFYLHLQLEAVIVKSRKGFGVGKLALQALRDWARGLWQPLPRHIPSRKECDSVCKAVGYRHTALSVGNIAQV